MATEKNKEAAATSKLCEKASALPWRTRFAVFLLSLISDLSRRRDGTVIRGLMNFLDLKAPPNPTKPIRGVKTYDVTVDPHRNLWFRVLVPSPAGAGSYSVRLPVMVFFHGGGFAFLSADTKAYDAACRRFARRIPAIVVSVNYRLAPEHRYPAQYEDGFDVLKFLDEDQQGHGLPENADLSRCFLIGDSAGANLAHHVAKRAAESKFRQLKVKGLVAIQPFFGGEERTEPEKRLTQLVSIERTDWMWKAWMGPNYEDRDHEDINVSGPRAADIAAVEGFPAVMVVVGGLDGLQEWQRRYYRWLKAGGKEAHLVEYPNMVHAFYVFPELPESAYLISQVADFVHNHASS